MIQLENIEKTYPASGGSDAVLALRGISLTIEEGEIFGVIGKSGAGKSTLIRCINLLERPTAGTVTVNGQELTSFNEQQLREARKKIGMIFQHFNLLSSRTVFENVAFPLELAGASKKEIEQKVNRLLELVELSDKRDQYPAQLSGGQKQRVGIARALANQPTVLLCDEATSALDPQTTKAILELLKNINKQLGLTIVLITHEMQVIKEICDRVAVIENGVISEEGPVLDVFTQPKTDTTREFIRTIINHDLPEILADVPFSPTPLPEGNLVLRLSFLGQSAEEPVIATLIRQYQVTPNILYGNIDHIQSTPYGTLILELSGAQADLDAALAYLEQRNLGIEVIGYVARHASLAG